MVWEEVVPHYQTELIIAGDALGLELGPLGVGVVCDLVEGAWMSYVRVV